MLSIDLENENDGVRWETDLQRREAVACDSGVQQWEALLEQF